MITVIDCDGLIEKSAYICSRIYIKNAILTIDTIFPVISVLIAEHVTDEQMLCLRRYNAALGVCSQLGCLYSNQSSKHVLQDIVTVTRSMSDSSPVTLRAASNYMSSVIHFASLLTMSLITTFMFSYIKTF